MGRFLMYTTLALLAAFVLTATFVLKHGGGETVAVSQVRLHELTSLPGRFSGQTLTTEGILRFSPEHDRFEISDEDGLPIAIRHYRGGEDLRPLRGKRVKVSGRFGLDKETGPYIDAEAIRPAE